LKCLTMVVIYTDHKINARSPILILSFVAISCGICLQGVIGVTVLKGVQGGRAAVW